MELHKLGLMISVSYNKVLQLENQIAYYTVCDDFRKKGVVCPCSSTIYVAIKALSVRALDTYRSRGIDHNPSSTTAKDSKIHAYIHT